MKEWTLQQVQDVVEQKEVVFVYFYTTMCGTCQVASKMLRVVEELLPDLCIGMSNVNYVEPIAHALEIESVPCLVAFQGGKMVEKVYAFRSVEHVYMTCKQYMKTPE
ncbi:thioredoxin family protein [Priestia taiwanensis]|uniref:Thioredoxin-like protein YusE n=1 Tax=Priestia taiwanensis TaxID=1347902 RepID=A0A917ERI2_9BACI|nr:thioredoxin family protein [Priestia taiwanensis]GGE80818.1 thioredoxin-like protein YusE [Priestia taiwanensis]